LSTGNLITVYILAYKSLLRISRPLKLESVCGPKSLTRVYVVGGFWGLVLDAGFAQQRPIYTKILCTGRHLQCRRDEWPTSRQATCHAVGRRALASAWPLMHNWDHG